jgi:hypothetical protein
VRDKGEGQIILLRSRPTEISLESVVEYTKRPLPSIAASDLGHEPEALEKSLLSYFKKASNWDTIAFLEEADVYLEKRTLKN